MSGHRMAPGQLAELLGRQRESIEDMLRGDDDEE